MKVPTARKLHGVPQVRQGYTRLPTHAEVFGQ
jgi:hypothetical protein